LQLEKYLAPLKNKNYISLWSDNIILPGAKWNDEILENLHNSDIIIFLLSSNLLASDFVMNHELPIALELQQKKDISIVPILVSECLWEITLFKDFQLLPFYDKSIYHNYWTGRQDEAYAEVARGIHKLCIKKYAHGTGENIEHKIDNILRKKHNISSVSINPDSKGDENALDQLISVQPTIGDIITTSAYDLRTNIGGKFTSDLFKEYLLVKRDIENHLDRLDNLISNPYGTPARFVFLNGFAGNGKTTFLNYFIEERSEKYDFIVYDFDKSILDRDISESRDRNKNKYIERAVLDILLSYLAENESELISTFNLIQIFRNELFKSNLIEEAFYDLTGEKLNGDTVKDQFFDLFKRLKKLGYKDTFTCFFIHIFIKSVDSTTKIIVFDNLDAINNEHLGHYFFKSLGEALWNADPISNSSLFKHKNIDFQRKFKFIFSLRDANLENIIPHIKSRLNIIDEIRFKFSIDSKLYNEVVDYRIKFYNKLCLYDKFQNKIPNLKVINYCFDTFLKDNYFNRVFVPMFNYDFRGSSLTLLQSIIDNLNHFSDEVNQKNPISLRGALVFNVVKRLKINNFLSEYDPEISITKNGEIKPYCFIDRMLLLVVLHYSRCKLKDYEDIDEASPVSIRVIIDNLIGAYKLENIVRSIAKCFLYHQEDWVHLITVLNKEIKDTDIFVREICSLYNKRSGELDRIKIRINPSGYVFLRYVLRHFEFYSYFGGNKKPLFVCTGDKEYSNDTDYKYDFEIIMNNSFEVVSKHISAMKQFYEKHYHPKLTQEEYRNSSFSFKPIEKDGRYGHGYFHSTYIITTHVEYIERFRQFVFQKIENIDEKRNINKIIVSQIERYVDLMRNGVDDRAIKDFYHNYESKIKIIKQSNYNNFSELIRQPTSASPPTVR
jgi:hypothetical protein